MIHFIVQLTVKIICFGLSYYALQALDFNRFLKQNHVIQAQILMFILAMALGYLTAEFLLSLSYQFYY